MGFDVSPTGWMAAYDHGALPYATRPVERFSEEGEALVVDERSGNLVSAAGLHGFAELTRCSTTVSVIPADPGWTVTFKDGDTSFTEPIVAWIVNDVGNGNPLVVDDDRTGVEEPWPRDAYTINIRDVSGDIEAAVER